MATPEYRQGHPKGFTMLSNRMDLSGAKVADVLASRDRACVVLSGLVPKGRQESMSLGLGLRRHGGRFLIRDVDALPSDTARREFIAGFQRSLFAAHPMRREYIAPSYIRAAEELSAEGWRLWKERKLSEAEKKFEVAVSLDPTNTNAWNGLGWAQFNQGKPLSAKKAFEKAVAIDPKAAASWNGLGWIAKGQGKASQAIEHWLKAIAAAPKATAALNGLATTYMELGRYDKAIESYQQWLKAEPGNANAKAGLKKAREAAGAVKVAVPAAEAWLKMVDAGKHGESWDAAAESFRKSVTKNKWRQQLQAVRGPLGKVRSRKLTSTVFTTSLPGAPDGSYVVIQFQAVFENKKQAVETVTPIKGDDGTWQVSGYYVK